MYRNKAALLFVIALSARLLFFCGVHSWESPIAEKVIIQQNGNTNDIWGYNSLAQNLYKNGQFSVYKDGIPNTFRTPGYPFFIAIFYFFFGEYLWIVLLTQLIVDSITTILIFFLLKEIINIKAAFLGALFYALDPIAILWSNDLYPDILFSMFIVLSVFGFIKAYNANERRNIISYLLLTSFSIGIATLIKPVSLYLPSIFVLFILIKYRAKIIKRVIISILFTFVFVGVLTPWLIRNQLLFNSLSLSSNGYDMAVENILLLRNKEKSMRDSDKQQIFAEVDSDISAEGKDPKHLSEIEKQKYFIRILIHDIRAKPVLFLKYYISGILKIFTSLQTTEYSRLFNQETSKPKNTYSELNYIEKVKDWFMQRSVFELSCGFVIMGFLFITYSAGIFGVYKYIKLFPKDYLLLSTLIIVYFCAITGFAGHARYKLPIIPFYMQYVGLGVYYLFNINTFVKQTKKI